MISDLRYALRSLWKNPVFALSAVLTIALGIGSATVSFTALNALLLRPLPFIQHQERRIFYHRACKQDQALLAKRQLEQRFLRNSIQLK